VTSHPRHAEPLPLGGDGVPYSKGLMARALIAVGVPAERAHVLARRVEADLHERGQTVADLDRIAELAEDEVSMRRLRRYLALRELDLPVIVLLGGGTGTGKSTAATEIAYRLGITRVTSTDFIRQTMRAFFSSEFMPSIHFSSFEAAGALRRPEEAEDPAISGFFEQSRNVLVGVRASLDRALEEGWSMVLEGIHLVPGMVGLPPAASDAIVAQCVFTIDDPDQHEVHFYVRDAHSDGVRPVARYLDHFEEIRRIQAQLVARAHREGVPVIDSGAIDRAVTQVLDLVLEAAAARAEVPA
jgi:2-phosphoglycerate kinase